MMRCTSAQRGRVRARDCTSHSGMKARGRGKRSAFTKAARTLEVGRALAARLAGGLRDAARRVGIAMSVAELRPPTRTITDFGERRTDRKHREIDALLAKFKAVLVQQRSQKKGESLEMFFAAKKLQRRRSERMTDHITRFDEGVKLLQDNDTFAWHRRRGWMDVDTNRASG